MFYMLSIINILYLSMSRSTSLRLVLYCMRFFSRWKQSDIVKDIIGLFVVVLFFFQEVDVTNKTNIQI